MAYDKIQNNEQVVEETLLPAHSCLPGVLVCVCGPACGTEWVYGVRQMLTSMVNEWVQKSCQLRREFGRSFCAFNRLRIYFEVVYSDSPTMNIVKRFDWWEEEESHFRIGDAPLWHFRCLRVLRTMNKFHEHCWLFIWINKMIKRKFRARSSSSFFACRLNIISIRLIVYGSSCGMCGGRVKQFSNFLRHLFTQHTHARARLSTALFRCVRLCVPLDSLVLTLTF